MADDFPQALKGQLGVNAVEHIFLEQFGWIFRRQLESDFGIDAQVEVMEDDRATGRLFALQIKSGPSYFRKSGDGYVYRGELRHLDYWTRHSLPVYLILHNPENDLVVYQRVERHRCEITESGWSIRIPATQVLDAKASYYFSKGVVPDDESRRRFRFAVDKALMEKIDEGEVYFVWENWVNKHLGLRNLKIFIGEYERWGDREPDVEYPMWYLLGHDIADAMETYFPWVEYDYAEEVEEDPEVEGHVLVGRLSEAALGYLKAEAFFRDGGDWEPPEPTYATTEHDRFMAALEADWEAEEAEAERKIET